MLRRAAPSVRLPSSRAAPAMPRRVPAQAVKMAARTARLMSTATRTPFSASRFRQAVKLVNLRLVPARGYAKDIEYPDWEQYEKFDKYEYRGEMHEEHQFWDPDSVVPEWDDNVSLAELGYGLFMLALALFVLYIYATINALYSADPNMLESSLTPFGRHWVERGYSSEYLPPIPAGRNERLEQHNIYTLPNALDAIENRPGVKKYEN